MVEIDSVSEVEGENEDTSCLMIDHCHLLSAMVDIGKFEGQNEDTRTLITSEHL